MSTVDKQFLRAKVVILTPLVFAVISVFCFKKNRLMRNTNRFARKSDILNCKMSVVSARDKLESKHTRTKHVFLSHFYFSLDETTRNLSII